MKSAQMRKLLADFATGPQTRLIAIKVNARSRQSADQGHVLAGRWKLTLAQTAAADH
jgi:hypothetical protein